MIAKTHTPTAPTQGQSFTYTVTVTNTSTTHGGPGNGQRPVRLAGTDRDHLDGHRLDGRVGDPALRVGPITGVQVTLPPGGAVTFTVHATVRADWPGGEVENTSVGRAGRPHQV